MDPNEEAEIIKLMKKSRNMPYSFEILEVQGDKYTVRNNFGSTITYIRKGNNFELE